MPGLQGAGAEKKWTDLTIMLTGGASVTEQLIDEVNMWMEDGE